MEGENRFPISLITAVTDKNFDGQSIVAISRLLLSQNYNDIEYNQEFFNTFNIIIDDDCDGVSFDEIEEIYKKGFVESLAKFKEYFSI